MRVLAFDFGASTGRALIGEVKDGILEYSEVNRFDNTPYVKDGHMYWDFGTLWSNIKESIRRAKDIDSIGIDTWGVDYGIIDKCGKLKHDPHHYRDSRVDDVYDRLTKKYGDDLYKRTGIQVMKFNTMFQLVSEVETGGFDEGDKILFMPDLFAYMLTGTMASEYTIATTSGLVDKETRDWNKSLIEELGIPKDIFVDIVNNGTTYGYLKEELMQELGLKKPIKVIAVCTHDTASAITSMVGDPSHTIYVSSGTWSLMGVEEHKVNTENPLFTNEGGYNGSITYLSNIMGLWLMQEFRRVLKREGKDLSFPELEALMKDAKEGKYIVDTNDDVFVAPENMETAIRDYIKTHNLGEIESRGEVVRCIYDSLAEAYRERAEMLNAMYDNKYDTINILGGGSQARPLIERTHKISGLKVMAGPIEATAIGNILVQLMTLNEIENIEEARKIVERSEKVKIYD